MAIRKLLIANRGEIAVRIVRTCRVLGISSVAVFSEADQDAIHTKLADEAVPIGDSSAANSYLRIDRLIEAARQTSSDAIHPGYGFLSERPELADACEEAGILFVGPPAGAMRLLGDKISAKTLAVDAGVPVVPGFFDASADQARLAVEAERIGYPLMLKASAGGGGRGMRVVRSSTEFAESLSVASNEALNAFGDGTMMLERLIESPRHIEVQVLADEPGTVACLFERECSIQRRHQKLIEETPSPYVSLHPDIWDEMSEAARAVVKRSGYRNAGTVEFIVDPTTGAFHFLEVNARLQVEHPVTEAVTGLDLVAWQLRIAEGLPLRLASGLSKGDRRSIQGHAIEARVTAEDPANGFRPSVGRILGWAEPRMPGVRVDSGFGPKSEVSPFYDSLLAKVIAHGETRDEAIRRLMAALLDFHILGVRTNIAFLLDVLDDAEFRSGEIDTGFLERRLADWGPGPPFPEVGNLSERAIETANVVKREAHGAWFEPDAFRNVRSR